MQLLVPGRGARENQLDGDSEDIHISKRLRPHRERARGSENEEEDTANNWQSEMGDSVGNPGKDIQNGKSVRGKDIGEVCAVHDVFKGREDLDPNMRAVFGCDKSIPRC